MLKIKRRQQVRFDSIKDSTITWKIFDRFYLVASDQVIDTGKHPVLVDIKDLRYSTRYDSFQDDFGPMNLEVTYW